ncbi:cysteine desulfurase [Myxococcota bacterium]|nr:cysteine desulfurase [Myxococcota bacterium]
MTAVPRRERGLDPAALRTEFPALDSARRGRPLVYLDSASEAQKPQVVIDAITGYLTGGAGDPSRNGHVLGRHARAACEATRHTAQRFLGAEDPGEIVFVRGTTDAVNLVASTWGPQNVHAGDELVVTELEHTSNLAPWHALATRVGAALRIAPMSDDGELDLGALASLVGPRTKLVAITHASHVFGTQTPVRTIAGLAHGVGAKLFVDGAQAVAHQPVDVTELGADFYCFSGRKVYGPSGTGVLWARRALLDAMPPHHLGNHALRDHGDGEGFRAEDPPARFEAGAPNVEGLVGLGAALEWLMRLDRAALAEHETALLGYALDHLAEVPGLSFVGRPRTRVPVIAFVLATVHAHDLVTVLDDRGIAVRAGRHSAPLTLRRLGLPEAARLSIAAYTTRQEIDALVTGLRITREVFG